MFIRSFVRLSIQFIDYIFRLSWIEKFCHLPGPISVVAAELSVVPPDGLVVGGAVGGTIITGFVTDGEMTIIGVTPPMEGGIIAESAEFGGMAIIGAPLSEVTLSGRIINGFETAVTHCKLTLNDSTPHLDVVCLS